MSFFNRKNDERSRFACAFDQSRQMPRHILNRRHIAAAFIDQSAMRTEIILHVDHDQGSVVRIDFLTQ